VNLRGLLRNEVKADEGLTNEVAGLGEVASRCGVGKGDLSRKLAEVGECLKLENSLAAAGGVW